jgi:hypothetical protein
MRLLLECAIATTFSVRESSSTLGAHPSADDSIPLVSTRDERAWSNYRMALSQCPGE